MPRKDTLCALPFVHLNVMPNGTVHPCCSSPLPLTDEKGAPFNIRNAPLATIWNSPAARDIRRTMLRGKEPRHCADCYNTERAGFDSVRTNYNRMILQRAGASDEFTGFTRVDRGTLKEEMPPPTYFDLRFDNVCNLKCVICYAAESSSIEADPVHTAWTGEGKIIRIPNRFENSKKWVAADPLFEELRDFAAQAQYIRLAGGEPFRSALALRWLAYLGESGKAANISLQIYTNLQLFNERIIALLAPFRFISMILSIDGVGETYEYIRYPGKWSRIEEAARLLTAERHNRLRRMGVSINATMSIPGAMRIIDLFEWARSHAFDVTLSNAVDPAHVSTRYLPRAAKKRLERQLREYAARNPAMVNLPGQIDQWMTDMYSVDTRDPVHRETVHDAMRFLNDMDKSRGLDFKRLQPDLVADYAAECGAWNGEQRFASIGAAEPVGTLHDGVLTIGERRHLVGAFSGGSIESCTEHAHGYTIGGWAIDTWRRRPCAAVAIAVGHEVVGTVKPWLARPDIAAGFGRRARPAGFRVLVDRRGERPTSDAPVRMFALCNDGQAAPLASALGEVQALARVPFTPPPRRGLLAKLLRR